MSASVASRSTEFSMMAAKKGEKKEEVSWMFGLFGKPPPAKEKES